MNKEITHRLSCIVGFVSAYFCLNAFRPLIYSVRLYFFDRDAFSVPDFLLAIVSLLIGLALWRWAGLFMKIALGYIAVALLLGAWRLFLLLQTKNDFANRGDFASISGDMLVGVLVLVLTLYFLRSKELS